MLDSKAGTGSSPRRHFARSPRVDKREEHSDQEAEKPEEAREHIPEKTEMEKEHGESSRAENMGLVRHLQSLPRIKIDKVDDVEDHGNSSKMTEKLEMKREHGKSPKTEKSDVVRHLQKSPRIMDDEVREQEKSPEAERSEHGKSPRVRQLQRSPRILDEVREHENSPKVEKLEPEKDHVKSPKVEKTGVVRHLQRSPRILDEAREHGKSPDTPEIVEKNNSHSREKEGLLWNLVKDRDNDVHEELEKRTLERYYGASSSSEAERQKSVKETRLEKSRRGKHNESPREEKEKKKGNRGKKKHTPMLPIPGTKWSAMDLAKSLVG